MAWTMHFGGDAVIPISDETYVMIKDNLIAAAQQHIAATFGFVSEGETIELFWTLGVPVIFRRGNETDTDREFARIVAPEL